MTPTKPVWVRAEQRGEPYVIDGKPVVIVRFEYAGEGMVTHEQFPVRIEHVKDAQ